MNKYIILLCITLACCFGSCQDDLGIHNGTSLRNPEEGLPVTFIAEALPSMESVGDIASRANDPYKQIFEDGDFIHVSATFTLLNENGGLDENAETVSQYELLRFNKAANEWQSTDSQLLTWPWNADHGVFTAYFIGASDGLLNANDPKVIALDTLTYLTDPLKAVSEEIQYGHAVPLKFEHQCAKLTLTNVPGDAIEFWAKADESNSQAPINNQYEVKLTQTDTDETIEAQFTSTGENAHIAAQRTADNSLIFYLAPGNYYGMKLNYRYNRPYRGLNIDGLKDLEAGKTYVIDFTKHTGSITIEDDDDGEEDPETNPDAVELVTPDINKFLQAIHDGSEYKDEESGQIILADEGDGRTALLVNVDFQGNDFDDYDLPATASFNGNGHYIKNIIRPLFNNVHGKISNLGVYNDIDNENPIIIEENMDPEINASAVGAIARECQLSNDNPDEANIDNVRLGNITIYVKPPLNADLVLDVGVAVGNCQGRVNNIRLAGNIKVEVATTDTEREIGTVNVGGIIGQLTTTGHLSNVSRMEEETPGSITVISACPNEINDRNTGGLVGLSNGCIEDCILSNATVDASGTVGTMVYTGGLAGMARGTQGSHETTTNGIFRSKFDGIIKCGLAYSEDYSEEGGEIAEGHAYAGGAVGYAYWTDNIQDNEISGILEGPTDDEGFKPWDNSIYATGGLFGQIFESPTSGNTTRIELTNQYEGTNYYVGKIAGRADENSNSSSNQSYTPGEWEPIGMPISAAALPGESITTKNRKQ